MAGVTKALRLVYGRCAGGASQHLCPGLSPPMWTLEINRSLGDKGDQVAIVTRLLMLQHDDQL